jgi:hypothetical protein
MQPHIKHSHTKAVLPPCHKNCTIPLLVIIGIVVGLAFTVQLPSSAGQLRTVGQGKQYTTIQSCLNAAQAGDTCLVYSGTYAPAQFVRGGNTTAGPITLKAVNPVWNCPGYTPDTGAETGNCTRSTTGISTISGSGDCLKLTATGLTNIRIHGFDFRCSGAGVNVLPSSGAADNIEIGFSHFQGSSTSADLSVNRFEDTDGNGWSVDAHHLSFYEPKADGPATDYALAMYLGSRAQVHNIWCGNGYNHCISLKRYVRDTSIRYVSIEGSYDGVYIGQNADDPNSFNGPACSADRDSTCGNITITWLFVRGTNDPNSDRPTPAQPLRVHNAYNVTANQVFIAHATRGVYAAKEATAQLSKENGLCRAKGEDLTIGCGLFVSPQQNVFLLHTRGIENDAVTLKNFVAYAPGATHFNFRNSDNYSGFPAACTRQETCNHPYTNWQNGIFVNGPALTSSEIAARTTEQNNDYYGLASRNQTGDTNLNPQFAGPTTVPRGNGVPTLDWSQIRTYAKGFYTTNSTLIAQNKGINACFR